MIISLKVVAVPANTEPRVKTTMGYEEKPFPAQERAPPGGHDDHDDLSDGVAAGDPGDHGKIDPEGPPHISEGDVYNRRIQDRDERREHHGERHHPPLADGEAMLGGGFPAAHGGGGFRIPAQRGMVVFFCVRLG